MIHKFIIMMKTDATNVPIPGEFNDDADFFTHPICCKYEANRLGVIRNIKSKKIVGTFNKRGYLKFSCGGICCKGDMVNKRYQAHRFIYECFNGLIDKGKVIDHIDNDPSNNKLENLQMISQSDNCKKNNCGGFKQAQKIRAINLETGEIFIYRSHNGAAKDLHLSRGNITKVINGLQKTILSKKLNQRFTFQKIEHDTEKLPIIIINKKNINIKHVRSMRVKKMIVNNSS